MPTDNIPVVVVLREENYETKFGDGYYAYVDNAFRTKADAEKYQAKKTAEPLPPDNNTGWTWHIREGVLKKGTDGNWAYEGTLKEGETVEAIKVAGILGLPMKPE